MTLKTAILPALLLLACLLIPASAAPAPQEDEPSGKGLTAEGFSFLSLEATGADRFLKDHPEYDGRGVVIFVLDNGADVGVPGLLETTTGEPKFIDAQDFTGEGDVPLEEAELAEGGVLKNAGGTLRVTGIDRLPMKAEGDVYYLGVLEEERLKNSEFEEVTGTRDINDNGESDDVFAVLAYPAQGAEYWVVFVDTDADGDVGDEELHRSFKDDLKPLYFTRRLPESQTRPMTVALNVFPGEKKVVFHYPGGGHSTHVSGIAAGYGIEGQKGFNGVAPGARLVSLKIGDGTLSGGATVTSSMKDAYEYVREYAEERGDEVVIVNMSYGIGSEVEGASDIDRYLDDLLIEHPNIIVCTSAGNEGPGISTVGTPAASFMAVSVGAVMAKETARDAYAAELSGHRLLHFSSRGGELDKPDITAPGACLSSVPRWSRNSRFWGTSMASPYMAGVMALLASAAGQEFPDRKVHIGMLRRAVQNSADSLEGATTLGQGLGFVNVPRAWEFLKKYLSADPDPVLAYRISTLSPMAPGGSSRAAYWRSVYRPGDEAQVFRVTPVFLPGTPADVISEFFRSFNLEARASFLKAVQHTFPVRQDHAGTVRVQYDPDRLIEPGLYTGRVVAYNQAKAPFYREFDLLNTVVVPHTFGPGNGYTLQVKGAATEPLETARYFLAVPPGASRMNVKLSAPEGSYTWSRMALFDPAGREFAYLPGLSATRNALVETTFVEARDLTPGVWELVVWGDYRAGKTSHHDLKVDFMGFEVHGTPALSLDYEPGKTPRGSFSITNLFDKAVWATAAGSVWGYRRTLKEHLKDRDEYTRTFGLDEGLSGVRFALSMSPEDYGLFTDFAINILNEEGVSLLKEGLSYRKTEFFFENPGGTGTYTLQMIAAFAHEDPKPFDFTLEEAFVRAEPVPVKVAYTNGDSLIPLVPGIPSRVEYTLEGVPPVAPKEYHSAATLIFSERGTEREVLRVRLDAPAGGK